MPSVQCTSRLGRHFYIFRSLGCLPPPPSPSKLTLEPMKHDLKLFVWNQILMILDLDLSEQFFVRLWKNFEEISKSSPLNVGSGTCRLLTGFIEHLKWFNRIERKFKIIGKIANGTVRKRFVIWELFSLSIILKILISRFLH